MRNRKWKVVERNQFGDILCFVEKGLNFYICGTRVFFETCVTCAKV